MVGVITTDRVICFIVCFFICVSMVLVSALMWNVWTEEKTNIKHSHLHFNLYRATQGVLSISSAINDYIENNILINNLREKILASTRIRTRVSSFTRWRYNHQATQTFHWAKLEFFSY